MHNNEEHTHYAHIINKLIVLVIVLALSLGACLFFLANGIPDFLKLQSVDLCKDSLAKEKVKVFNRTKSISVSKEDIKMKLWSAPDLASIANEKNAEQITYGRELIMHTANYLGPKGSVTQISNGMNCQNCHLDAGTKPFGNNYSGVASTYPKLRQRSGKIESIYKRVNDCFERSLNGIALDTNTKEIQAIKAYIVWLGKNVSKGDKPAGSGIKDLAYLNRAADPEKGKIVYQEKCKKCHSENGEGKLNADKLSYEYPPLWGEHSYNLGAGLYRISRFAGYVKYNMPQGTNWENPQLSDEEAWDVAAFVNSQPRPKKDLHLDWPKITGKPIDYPFGPFADNFTETQHKYGPFEPIEQVKKKNN